MSKKLLYSLFAAVLIAAIGGAWLTVDAQAQGGGWLARLRQLRPAVGQVTAVSADALTIQSLKGETLTFAIDDRTRVRSREDGQGSDGTLDDVQVGRWVAVLTVKNAPANPAAAKPLARAIVLLPEDLDPASAENVRGRITSVDAAGSRFTVETRKNESVTVRVDADTLYKGEVAALADLQVGMQAGVIAEKQSNGDLLAYSVRAGMPRVRRVGEVVAVNTAAKQFTLKLRRDGSQATFSVDDQTRFRGKDGSVKSFADLQPGMQLGLQAIEQGAGKYLARVVLVLPIRK